MVVYHYSSIASGVGLDHWQPERVVPILLFWLENKISFSPSSEDGSDIHVGTYGGFKMKNKINGVDMDAAIKYMVAHDCRLDEAIAAVGGVVVSKKEKRVVEKTSTTEKPKTRLKAARIKAGLSQSELAKKAGLNIRTLQAYEQGYKSFDNARLETILKVALACDCRLEELIESPDLLGLLKKYNEA